MATLHGRIGKIETALPAESPAPIQARAVCYSWDVRNGTFNGWPGVTLSVEAFLERLPDLETTFAHIHPHNLATGNLRPPRPQYITMTRRDNEDGIGDRFAFHVERLPADLLDALAEHAHDWRYLREIETALVTGTIGEILPAVPGPGPAYTYDGLFFAHESRGWCPVFTRHGRDRLAAFELTDEAETTGAPVAFSIAPVLPIDRGNGPYYPAQVRTTDDLIRASEAVADAIEAGGINGES